MDGERSEYQKKQFYSISEVAEIVGTNETTLRFWEREFKEINPRRASRGVRLYSNTDLEAVKLIYHLVKEKGMTLEGAKKRLKGNTSKESNIMNVVNRLKSVRAELMAIRNYIQILEIEESNQLSKRPGRRKESEKTTVPYPQPQEEKFDIEEPTFEEAEESVAEEPQLAELRPYVVDATPPAQDVDEEEQAPQSPYMSLF